MTKKLNFYDYMDNDALNIILKICLIFVRYIMDPFSM